MEEITQLESKLNAAIECCEKASELASEEVDSLGWTSGADDESDEAIDLLTDAMKLVSEIKRKIGS